MEKPPPNKNFFLVFLFGVGFLFFSCAEDKAQVVAVRANLVFDFSKDGAPSQWLSVFAQLSSDVRRIDSVFVTHESYTWKIETPLLFQSEKNSWAGYMRLEAPPNLKKLPKGMYSVECVDATGNNSIGRFFVDYDDALLENAFSDETFADEKWKKQVAVYSDVSELLYFDVPKEEWLNEQEIFSAVKNSNSFRNIFQTGATLCLAPKIYKDGGSSDGQ